MRKKLLPLVCAFYVSIGKERLFLEVARSLRQKVYVTAAKLRLLKCLEFTEEDMQWFTSNEHESNIHVAPMWTLASFKRLKHISSQYAVSAAACFSITTIC
jgi:DNA cross-link repair 1A protein